MAGPMGKHDPVNGDTWRDQANCLGTDTRLFFPGRGDSVDEAKAVCAGCTVRESCLEYALTHNQQHGVFGGKTERERRRIRRQRRRDADRGAA